MCLVYMDLNRVQVKDKDELNGQYSYKITLPLLEPFIEQCVVSAKNEYNVKPSLREKVAAVIVYHITSPRHLLFQFINNLHTIKTVEVQAQ